MRWHEMMPGLPKNWRETAERVNADVNAIPYKADIPGVDDWADIGPDGGDCDNYAIGKLRRLLAAGFPIERLRLATCFVGGTGPRDRGEAHAVLVIDVPDDHYVLDNRFAVIVPVFHLIGNGYTLESIQAVGGSHEWIKWKHA